MKFKEAEARVRGYLEKFKSEFPNPATMEIAIIPIIDSILDHEKFLWDIKIVVAKTNETFSHGCVYENPESGYDRAIRYCLENLI